MTQRTIRIMDLCCSAHNTRSTINSDKETLERWRGYSNFREQDPDVVGIQVEIAQWTRNFERIKQRIYALMAKLTPHEIAFMQKLELRNKTKWSQELREIGIEPIWM